MWSRRRITCDFTASRIFRTFGVNLQIQIMSLDHQPGPLLQVAHARGVECR
jgi:hypothetical protein